MCMTPEAEMESRAHDLPVILPPRRSHTLQSNHGRYGIDPAPIGPHDFGESLRFWLTVWGFCIAGGLSAGFLLH